ncbi:MAG: YidC/Oxa1 family insertase periplasmic-domain containing protein [bacterium]
MNNRFFLALVLTAAVIVATPLLFSNSMKRTPAPVASDTSARHADSVTAAASATASPQTVVQATPVTTGGTQSNPASATPETTLVHTSHATYAFSTRGGVPISIVLDSYPSHRTGTGPQNCKSGKSAAWCVELVKPHTALTSYRLALGRDTIGLDTVPLRVTHETGVKNVITYTGEVAGHSVRLAYDFPQDSASSYLARISASISSAPTGSSLLVGLPETLLANEADTVDDLNHLAVSFRPTRGDVTSVAFAKLDSAEVRSEPGPINWIATRNKYFLVALRAGKVPFSTVRLQGVPRKDKIAKEMRGTIALPVGAEGNATFEIYAGPQNFERLQHLGGDLDQVNPYAGFLHGAVQPFATMVMKALLWMKRTTQLNYGWVLVLFGVMIRLILWPLNQGAMRTSMKMQRLQPELQALQKKHNDDPKKQQEAIMKVYKEHGMSPLSPLMGCLPMLLPMPVLFALYYVFQNTIEFRGVSFLWLADISLRDPYYITPLLMGVSMFVMSWVGMKNSPPNPQAKMMSYMMPVMLTVLFLNFASGLNLYYAVQNIAAIPQQWLLARERGKQDVVVSGSAEKRRG